MWLWWVYKGSRCDNFNIRAYEDNILLVQRNQIGVFQYNMLPKSVMKITYMQFMRHSIYFSEIKLISLNLLGSKVKIESLDKIR
jgi:hypothetical protein